MAGIGEKIRLLIEQEGISVNQLERRIGAGKGVLYTTINKGTDINSRWLYEIIRNFPSYALWFFDLQGSLPAPENREQASTEEKLWKQVEFLSEQLKEKDTQIAKLLALLKNSEKII